MTIYIVIYAIFRDALSNANLYTTETRKLEETNMPFVNVRTARGLLNPQQKLQLHQELTELLVRVEGGGDPAFSRYVTVLLEEHDAESWSLSGQQLSDSAATELADQAAQRMGREQSMQCS